MEQINNRSLELLLSLWDHWQPTVLGFPVTLPILHCSYLVRFTWHMNYIKWLHRWVFLITLTLNSPSLPPPSPHHDYCHHCHHCCCLCCRQLIFLSRWIILLQSFLNSLCLPCPYQLKHQISPACPLSLQDPYSALSCFV
jgi:hypothetical protein